MKTKITPQDVQASIEHTYYFTAAETSCFAPEDKSQLREDLSKVSFCLLVLKNGTKVVGVNYGAIDSKDHDPAMGRQRAWLQALDKVYELLGYELRTALTNLKPMLESGNEQPKDS